MNTGPMDMAANQSIDFVPIDFSGNAFLKAA